MEKNKEIKKAMVLSSGGVDSTTCLGMAVEKYGKDQVIALSISYGQKHQKEIEASRKVAEYYGVEHLYLDLAPIFQYSNCSLLKHSDSEIPHESYVKTAGENKRNTGIDLCSVPKWPFSLISSEYCTLKRMQCDLLRCPCG